MVTAFLASNEISSTADALPSRTRVAKGLQNSGNTCFCNSTIQALAHTPFLAANALKTFSELAGDHELATLRPWAELLGRLWSDQGDGDASPQEFISTFARRQERQSGRSLFDGTHQDAHEFLLNLLSALDEDLKTLCLLASNSNNRDESAVSKVTSLSAIAEAALWKHVSSAKLLQTFQSVIVNTIQCNSCKHRVHQCDTPLVLSLAVPRSSDSQVSVSVESCLDGFFGGELVSDYRCSRCNAQGVTKTSLLTHSPDTLVLQLKRYSLQHAQSVSVAASKNEQLVRFGPSLNLDGILQSHKHNDYTLYAVVNHVGGSTKGGHYTAHVLQPYLRRWFQFDDSVVSDATFDQVVTTNAYMLFYAKSAFLPLVSHELSTMDQLPIESLVVAERPETIDTDVLNFFPVPEVWQHPATNVYAPFEGQSAMERLNGPSASSSTIMYWPTSKNVNNMQKPVYLPVLQSIRRNCTEFRVREKDDS